MPLTIIPIAPSVVRPMWFPRGDLSLPSIPAVGLSDSGFLRTSLPPPWEGGDTLRHPLWITRNSQYPQAIVEGSMPAEVPSPYRGMSAEWAATVSQLVYAGLAEISDGTATLTDFLRVRARSVKSRTISRLEELEWILSVHHNDSRISSGVIEPIPYEELIGPTKLLSASIQAGEASEEEKKLHTRMVRALIRRTHDSIAALRGSDHPEYS
ncbi:MAG TPA: hypothetical protein VLJ37_00595 [bacterium]|nr:hypothetical protein [bacterium]